MEQPEHEEPRERAGAADDESAQEFAEDLENDPAHNPPIKELKDLKGG